MLCEIRPFKLGIDGSTDESRWWIKTVDTDLRYWSCAGTKEKPVLYRSTKPYFFSSYEEAAYAAKQNGLEIVENNTL